jgi:putative glutamine amidotransferase
MKKIGITTRFIKDPDYSIPVVGLTDSYARSITAVDALPIYIPTQDLSLLNDKSRANLLDGWCDILDGLILSGGEDVNPKFYNQIEDEKLGSVCTVRDIFEIELFNKFLATNKKILGICRGHQLINVALGGTLIQDIPSKIKSSIVHSTKEDKWFNKEHAVKIKSESKLAQILNAQVLQVNSIHHQAIDQIADNLEACAYAEDGIIEACHSSQYTNLLSVQWHPETMWQVTSSKSQQTNDLSLFSWLVG